MKSVSFLVLFLSLSVTIFAQNSTTGTTPTGTPAETDAKKAPVFRATKDQVKKAQAILKERSFYNGEASGKLDDVTRIGLQKYQLASDLKITGTLNKETLEKMNIALTDSQKGIPKPPKPETADGEKKPPIFRATKDQIKEAQKVLSDKGFYKGEADGDLTEDTREGIRKYQATNDIKVTGTLNRETLERMSIQLTEKQKALQLPQNP